MLNAGKWFIKKKKKAPEIIISVLKVSKRLSKKEPAEKHAGFN